jgi:hypothetical protein
LSFTIASTPTAPVGSGSADGIPPHAAHEPIAITAAAPAATSSSTSSAGLPASFM